MLHNTAEYAAFRRSAVRLCGCRLLHHQKQGATAREASAAVNIAASTIAAAVGTRTAAATVSTCFPRAAAQRITYGSKWAHRGQGRFICGCSQCCRCSSCSSRRRGGSNQIFEGSKRNLSTLFDRVSHADLPAIQADDFMADTGTLQHMQQALCSQIIEACEYYGICVQRAKQQKQPQREQRQLHTLGLRVGLLLPPSPVSLAAFGAVAAIGGIAAPLPFCDAAVAAETAPAAIAAAGGVAAASAAAARPLAAAVEEAGGDMFVTRTHACNRSVITRSKSLRLLQQQLAEAKAQLLLTHPALAAAAAALCDQLGIHVCICGARTPVATDICIDQQPENQQPAAAATSRVRLFVRQEPLYTSSLAIYTKWMPLRTAEGGPLGPPQELKEALAARLRSGKDSAEGSVTSNSCNSSSKTSSNSLMTSATWSFLLEASCCWGQPRSVFLPAAAVKQQLQLNKEHLLHHVYPRHNAVVAASAAGLAKPKLLLAVVLPLVQQQANIMLLTRQQRPPLPLPLQVTLQQQPTDAATEALVLETAHARAAAVWRLLLHQKQQQQRYTLVVDLETAEAMLAHYDHAVETAAATATPSNASKPALEAPLAPATDLAAAAQQAICCCLICTDESDLMAMPSQAPSNPNHSTSTSRSHAAAMEQKPAVRVAATVEGWQRLLPAVATVQHVLTITEVGVVAVQQQCGSAGEGTVPLTKQRAATAAGSGQEDGVPLGHLFPGVAAVAADDGTLLFSNSTNSIYFERPVATAKAFGAPESLGAPGSPPGRYFRSALLGGVDGRGELRVLGCKYTSERLLQRPLQQRLQQWQWGLPRMERLIEGYVHKVPIAGKEWGNYHAKKRYWKRMF